jgi:hypothetical protein
MNTVQRARLAEDVVRRLAAAIRGAQLYAIGHPIVVRNVTALLEALAMMHAWSPSLAIGIVGEDLVVGDVPLQRAAENMGELMRRLQQIGVERIVVDRGVDSAELTQLVQALASADASQAATVDLPHVRIGRLQIETKVDAPAGDIATLQRLYKDAVSVAQRLWETATAEGASDPNAGRSVVDSLAQAVAQNRTALLALTAL